MIQTRPLTQLDDPEQQAEAWERAVETAPKDDNGKPKITAKHVQAVVDDGCRWSPTLSCS